MQKNIKQTFLLFSLLLLAACQPQSKTLRLATTTSTYDSGLLDAILPEFEQEFGATVEVISVGTGQAIAIGEAGDVDVILVHARSREDLFVADGYGVNRQEVMYNDFVVLGPEADPAGVMGAENLTAVFQQIAETKSPFISRGDDSGTHIREQNLWADSNIVPDGDWYQSVGQGMGATLTVADEQQAYTLSDRGTFIARQGEEIGLQIVYAGDEALFNPYGVIAVNPELHNEVDAELAKDFIDWLIAPSTQTAISNFRRNGQQLFFANADSK